MAKKLVALKDNLKLSLDPDQLKRGSADKAKLETIIKKYELKTLSEKLNIKPKKEIIKKDYNSLKSIGFEGRKNVLKKFDVDTPGGDPTERDAFPVVLKFSFFAVEVFKIQVLRLPFCLLYTSPSPRD